MLITPTGLKIPTIFEGPNTDAHAPAMCDVEVASGLRRIMREPDSGLTEIRAKQAIDDLCDLPITLHDHKGLLKRAFELRHNVSIYDAIYIALAEKLGARLLTADRAMASAPLQLNVEILAF